MPQPRQRVRERLHSAVMQDKVSKIEGMLKVIRAEEYKLLTNFMYLNREDLNVYVDITDDGEYILTIKAATDHLIDIGKTL